ncbi:hypothetical protein CA601_32125 [Paraburkholderia hospita]|nr:hypothetical protein CA601_32125 [Paraburkholderia hospita]
MERRRSNALNDTWNNACHGVESSEPQRAAVMRRKLSMMVPTAHLTRFHRVADVDLRHQSAEVLDIV